MSKIRWIYRYAMLLWRSPYEVTLWQAWREGVASWGENLYHINTADEMPTPADALYEDQMHWDMQ